MVSVLPFTAIFSLQRALASNGRKKKRDARGRHARGDGAPARENHENRFPTPIQLPGSRCVICQEFWQKPIIRANNNNSERFSNPGPLYCFISSIRSRFWWYTFHRQSKPRSSFWTNNVSSDLHFNDLTNLLSAAASANAYLMPNRSFVALWTNRNFLHSQKASKNGKASLYPHVSPSSAPVRSFLG